MEFQSTVGELYDELEQKLDAGNVDGALCVLDQICRKYEDHAGAWELRGILEAQAGRPFSSVHYLQRASNLAPLEIWSIRTLATQYVASNRLDLGIETFHRLGISGRLSTGMLRTISHDLIALKRPELSADVIFKAIELDRSNAVLWHELSAIQSLLGESFEESLRSVQRAIELAPNTTEFRVTAATILIQLDEVNAAYQVVSQVVAPDRVDVDCPCCLWRLICIFDCVDDHQRMSVCYERLRLLEAQESIC